MAPAECILIVDDDKQIRESLVEVLEEHGCTALGVANGLQAIEALQALNDEDRTCLIFLDLMMPVMDGRTFLVEQTKRAKLAAIPVVLISAYRDILDDAQTMNVAGYLQKPLKLADVLRTAKQYCVCDQASS